jgi:hypothetical protein
MDWHAFLDPASRLATGATEGDWRSTVSRAYYSVFHFFLDWLQSNGVALGRSATVQQLVLDNRPKHSLLPPVMGKQLPTPVSAKGPFLLVFAADHAGLRQASGGR